MLLQLCTSEAHFKPIPFENHLYSLSAWPSNETPSVQVSEGLDTETILWGGSTPGVLHHFVLHIQRSITRMAGWVLVCLSLVWCVCLSYNSTGMQRFSERAAQQGQQLGNIKASLRTGRDPPESWGVSNLVERLVQRHRDQRLSRLRFNQPISSTTTIINNLPAKYSQLNANVDLPISNNTALDMLLAQKAENFTLQDFGNGTLPDGNSTLHHGKDVIVLIFSQGVLQMLKNLLCTMKKLAMVHRIVGVALDVQAYNSCASLGIGCVLSDSFTSSSSPSSSNNNNSSETLLLWGGSAYKNMTRAKSRNVLEILKRGYNVFLIDVDIVLFKDPTAMFREGSLQWDLQVQSDSLYKQKAVAGEVNSGFYYMKCSEWSIRFLTHVWFLSSYFPNLSEQKLWNKLSGFKQAAKVGWKVTPLDPLQFCNGQVFFSKVGLKDKKYVRRADAPKDPYMVHFNWMMGYDKEKTMRHEGMWYHNSTSGECLDEGLRETSIDASPTDEPISPSPRLVIRFRQRSSLWIGQQQWTFINYLFVHVVWTVDYF